MPLTVAQLVTEARGHLQDSREPYRYSQSDLIAYLNNGVRVARTIRPDYFVATLLIPTVEYTANDNLSFDEQLYGPIVFYVVGSAQLRDDEFVEDSRAVAAMNLFYAAMGRGGRK